MDTSFEQQGTGKTGFPNRAMIGTAALLALFSASCCVLPIGLSILGLGGNWLLMLGPFVAYRVLIVPAVGLVLMWAWWRLFSRWAHTSRRRSTLAILVVATVCFILAVTAPLWEAEATRTMFAFWRSIGP